MSVRGTVGVVHRSRGGWVRGVTVVPEVNFQWDFRYVGWSRGMFSRYVSSFDRIVSAKFRFQVGYVSGRVCVSLQMRECRDFVVWLSNFSNLLQVFLF